MGRHSRKGRGDNSSTDTGAVPGIPAPTSSFSDTAGAHNPAAHNPAAQTPPAQAPAAHTPAAHTPAGGVPRFADGTPARGTSRVRADGTPAHGTPRVPVDAARAARGDHPPQREAGGGWGEFGSGAGDRDASAGRPAPPRVPRQRTARGPRQEYLDAFDRERPEGGAPEQDAPRRDASGQDEKNDVVAPRRKGAAARDAVTRDPGPGSAPAPASEEAPADGSPTAGEGGRTRSGRGRTFAGIAAAAVTTALAIVVAGQVTGGHGGTSASARPATGQARDLHGSGTAPAAPPSAAPLTFEQAMDRTYPLGATLKGPGTFTAVPGFAKAPGTGKKYTYRVDVEKGLGLDGRLFADAVQKTLNDDRSWAHHGARTFERVSSGKPDFVITLASPGTTATWCAKSGLDTTEDNVSCDSASTERVMINAYRWAEGSVTYGYGKQIHPYRQMLINHEVGHRLGYGHVTCDKSGELAPVMQQQTKFLDHDGIHCLPNAWPFPRS
ncbi:DUF3152 domain-containing protein [Streptomyces sp. NPDC052040]|uniref:DUF3152 domain-containing protein n=1 Tax=Streptomyces sp. NPDC052040 TaxID=3365682 RepID=UPI0037D7D579